MEPVKIDGRRSIRDATREQRDIWRAAFIEENDVTGYFFAEKFVVDGIRGWKDILACKDKRVVSEINEWQEALAVKLQAMGIIALASSGKDEANKWLAARGWIPKEDQRTKVARKQAEKIDKEVEKDLQRVGLHLVKTG